MASQIIRGTTPTIEFTFKDVTVANIVTAILSIKQNGVILIEKELVDATVAQKSLSWTLTQAECLTLAYGKSTVMLNWLLVDGTRGASNEYIVEIVANHINEVIT